MLNRVPDAMGRISKIEFLPLWELRKVTAAAARSYSPSFLSTSLVTPASHRPINRHGRLSRT
jgi:hypothetical protein